MKMVSPCKGRSGIATKVITGFKNYRNWSIERRSGIATKVITGFENYRNWPIKGNDGSFYIGDTIGIEMKFGNVQELYKSV